MSKQEELYITDAADPVSDVYTPPFHMTDEIINLMIEVGELVGRLSVDPTLSLTPKLRKETQIRSIYSSLAIEQNTLSLNQVTDVIEGRRVLGPPDDIQEVKNALDVYRNMNAFDPCSMDDLKKAHWMMMQGLITEAGVFRSGNVGIYSDGRLIHKGAPAEIVPEIMARLFDWMKSSPMHPLIKSCVFHYEFEYIHPFMDGNGRTGRFWQTLILQKWQPALAWLPVETLIHERQGDYYSSLNQADQRNDSTIFVTFILQLISEALRDICNRQLRHVGINGGINVGTNDTHPAETVLMILKAQPNATARRLAELTHLSSRQIERILSSLKQNGQIIRHGANKGGYWEVTR